MEVFRSRMYVSTGSWGKFDRWCGEGRTTNKVTMGKGGEDNGVQLYLLNEQTM